MHTNVEKIELRLMANAFKDWQSVGGSSKLKEVNMETPTSHQSHRKQKAS